MSKDLEQASGKTETTNLSKGWPGLSEISNSITGGLNALLRLMQRRPENPYFAELRRNGPMVDVPSGTSEFLEKPDSRSPGYTFIIFPGKGAGMYGYKHINVFQDRFPDDDAKSELAAQTARRILIKNPEAFPGGGSDYEFGTGFTVEQDGRKFIISNEHVLDTIDPSTKEITRQHEDDLAALALDERGETDFMAFQSVPQLSPDDTVIDPTMTGEELVGRRVTLSGLGNGFLKANGVVGRIPRDHPSFPKEALTHRSEQLFAIKIPMEQIGCMHQCFGVSGAPVIDEERGTVVGTFSNITLDAPSTGEKDFGYLLIFCGPEALRTLLKKAQTEAT